MNTSRVLPQFLIQKSSGMDLKTLLDDVLRWLSNFLELFLAMYVLNPTTASFAHATAPMLELLLNEQSPKRSSSRYVVQQYL